MMRCYLRVYKNQLICYYSDQRDSRYGQKLAHQTTTDLKTWSAIVDDIHDSNSYAARPGMPAITRLPNDNYIFAYEVCIQALHAFRTSTLLLITSYIAEFMWTSYPFLIFV